jgi:hypothetical protein
MTATRIAYTLEEAAQVTPFSAKTLRRAIKASDPAAFPPPLPAKRGPRGSYVVLADDLERWLRSLPDA